MLAALNKYRAVFNVGLQSNLVYRANFAIRGFFSFFHLIVVFILWGAAYSGNAKIGGFSFSQTFTYFIALIVVQFMVGAFNEDYQISEEIRNGLINQFLLKPINYFGYRFSIYLSARLVTGLLILLPLLVTYPLLRNYLELPTDLWRLAVGVPALFMSALILLRSSCCALMMAICDSKSFFSASIFMASCSLMRSMVSLRFLYVKPSRKNISSETMPML